MFMKSNLRALSLPKSWDLRAGKFFLLANVFAGAMNYLFQVVASRQLSAQGFSELNGWIADFSIFFMFGGVLQYISNFRPSPQPRLRTILTGINILQILFIAFWWWQPGDLTLARAILILILSAAAGWMTGQLQARLQFTVISLASLLIAAVKLSLIFIPLPVANPVDIFAWALFASFIPGAWLMTKNLWSADTPAVAHSPMSLTGPILLAVATAVVPQFDLVLLHHTQSAAGFAEFSRASLFFKAIYFLIFILAQWLLPRQVQAAKVGEGFSGLPAVGAVGLILSLGLAAVSPLVGRIVLGWSELPSPGLIFISCIHTTLLALVFLRIQSACARKNNRLAQILLFALAVEFALQWFLQLELYVYLVAVMAAQVALLIGSEDSVWQHRRAA